MCKKYRVERERKVQVTCLGCEQTRKKGRQLGEVVIVGGWMKKWKEQTSDSGGENRHVDWAGRRTSLGMVLIKMEDGGIRCTK